MMILSKPEPWTPGPGTTDAKPLNRSIHDSCILCFVLTDRHT